MYTLVFSISQKIVCDFSENILGRSFRFSLLYKTLDEFVRDISSKSIPSKIITKDH